MLRRVANRTSSMTARMGSRKWVVVPLCLAARFGSRMTREGGEKMLERLLLVQQLQKFSFVVGT